MAMALVVSVLYAGNSSASDDATTTMAEADTTRIKPVDENVCHKSNETIAIAKCDNGSMIYCEGPDPIKFTCSAKGFPVLASPPEKSSTGFNYFIRKPPPVVIVERPAESYIYHKPRRSSRGRGGLLVLDWLHSVFTDGHGHASSHK
jgi:hypothetical protein